MLKHSSFLLTAGLLVSASAHAITVTELTNTANNSQCSFEEAVAVANSNVATSDCANTADDIIIFDEDLFVQASSTSNTGFANLSLTNPKFNITDDLTIQVPAENSSNIFIDENILRITFTEDSDQNKPVFLVSANKQLTLKGVEIDGTNAPSAMVAELLDNASITIEDSHFKKFGIRDATTPANNKYNTKSLINATDNVANIVTIKDSKFSNNYVQGDGTIIFAIANKVSIEGSTFESNRAVWDGNSAEGGAVAIKGNTVLEVKSSTFARNSSEGNGGAIASLSSTAQVKIESTNFLENYSLDDGGAIYTNGNLYLYSSTFLKNDADAYKTDNNLVGGEKNGGAITIEAKSGAADPRIEVYNSLFAFNGIYGTQTINDCAGTIAVIEHSYINTGNGCTLPASTANSIIDTDFDGTIFTVKDSDDNLINYATDSPTLIDRGTTSGCVGIDGQTLTTDINGKARAQAFSDSDAICDIGSVEIIPLAISVEANHEVYTFEEVSDQFEKSPLTIEFKITNKGSTKLENINIGFTTPDGFGVVSNNSIKTGELSLIFGVDLDPGKTTTVKVAVVALAKSAKADFSIDVFSEDVNVQPSPLHPTYAITVKLEQGSKKSSGGSGGGGGLFWVFLPALLLVRRFKH